MKTQVKEILSSDRPLSFKIKYFLGYYTKTIIVCVLILATIVSLIYSMLHQAAAPDLQIAVVGTNAEIVQLKDAAKESDNKLHKLLTVTDNNSVLYVSDADAAYRQKYVLMMSAAQLDILVADDAEYAKMKKDNGLVDLTKNSELSQYADADDPYSITVGEVATVPEEVQSYHICIMSNTEQKSNAVAALKLLE